MKRRHIERERKFRVRQNRITSDAWLVEQFSRLPEVGLPDGRHCKKCLFCPTVFIDAEGEAGRSYVKHVTRASRCYKPIQVIDELEKAGFVQIHRAINPRIASEQLGERGFQVVALGSSVEHAHVFFVQRWLGEMLTDWFKHLCSEMLLVELLDAIAAERDQHERSN